jgi:hypothetical protein
MTRYFDDYHHPHHAYNKAYYASILNSTAPTS